MLTLEHSAILLTSINKQKSVLKTNFLSSFEWPLKTGFTVWAFKQENLTLLQVNNKSTDWPTHLCSLINMHLLFEGAQWLSGRVLDSRPRGRGFEPHQRHCIASLSKNINPSLVWFNPGRPVPL